MTQRRLIKKLIVTSNLQGLSIGRFILKTKGISTAMAANASIVNPILPLPATVITKIEALETLLDNSVSMLIAQKENTQLIDAQTTEIMDIITSQWAPKVQTVAAGDVQWLSCLVSR